MLKLVCIAALALVCIQAELPAPDHHHHGTSICKFIGTADCTIFAPHKFCATDAKTYNNQCEFSKAHCIMANLHMSHNGTCDPTVDKPDPNVSGHEIAYQFFCANLKHQKCGTDMEIVCGSDLKTYDNLCLFQQAKCYDDTLVVHTYQACPV